MANNNQSTPEFVRQLQFFSHESAVNTSAINNNNHSSFDDWNRRLQSFPANHNYLLHILELSPGESCPVKVLDLYKCYGTNQKYCPGYIRHLPDNPWLSPMRIFYSQSTKWELIDFMGTSIHIFDYMEGMQQSWGDLLIHGCMHAFHCLLYQCIVS